MERWGSKNNQPENRDQPNNHHYHYPIKMRKTEKKI
jgi:hypothetical protein